MPDGEDPAPDIVDGTVINNGGAYKSIDHLGETILLSFFERNFQSAEVISCLVALWNNYEDHGVQIVIVHPDFVNVANLNGWFADNELTVTFPVILGGNSWGAYMEDIEDGSDAIKPHSFIIDRNNFIRRRYYGIGIDEVNHPGYCRLHPGDDSLESSLLDVIYIRDPIDLEMVMDVSGSMNSLSPTDLTGDTKFIMMTNATKIIGDYLMDNGQDNDRMGLIWFTDDVGEYQDPISDQKLLIIRANSNWVDKLRPKIDGLITGNCTAMGAGLQTAFNTLTINGSTQKKFVILCTDGMQNRNPLVTKVGEHYEIIDGDEWCGLPSQNVEGHPNVNIATEYDTCVHTIGVGITANYITLLQEIAIQTGGFYKGTNDPGEDLDFIYLVDLCNCMAGGSPSILYHNTGNLGVEEHEKVENFYLNSSIRKITVILSWKESQGSNFMFWLYSPDGALLDLHTEMKLYENHCMATIYLPKRKDKKTKTKNKKTKTKTKDKKTIIKKQKNKNKNGEYLEYIGEWRMIIRGEIIGTCADYHAFVIGEDTEIKHIVDFPKKLYEVGDLLPIKVTVLKKKKPIFIMPKELVIETKFLRVPLPELLAQYKVSPYELLKKSEISTKKVPKNLLILKLKAMTSDPQFQKRLRPITKQLSLQEGNLKYKIENEEIFIPIALEQPGLHSFKIKVRYEDPENGPICRTDMVSIVVGPGKADPEQTKTNFMEISTEELKGKIINITPRNKKGQLLGPGHSYEFKLQVGKKEFDVEFKDLLDGTYQIELPVSEKEMVEIKEKDLDVDITFHNNLIWKGKL